MNANNVDAFKYIEDNIRIQSMVEYSVSNVGRNLQLHDSTTNPADYLANALALDI